MYQLFAKLPKFVCNSHGKIISTYEDGTNPHYFRQFKTSNLDSGCQMK